MLETQTETATATAQPQEIRVVATRGKSQVIKFTGKTWGELAPLVEAAGYDLSNMKAMDSVLKHTFEHPDALIPGGNFRLFLMPYESKAGSARSDAYAAIKSFKADNPDKAQAHFGNHTNKSTEELVDLIESYKPGTKKAVAKEKASAIADVVTSLASVKPDDVLANLAGLSDSEKLSIAVSILVSIQGSIVAVLAAVNTPLKSQEQLLQEAQDKIKQEQAEQKEAEELRKKKEQEEKEAQEEREAQAELQAVQKGFGKVRR